MKKLLTLSLIVILSSCATTKDSDRWFERSGDNKNPHVGDRLTTVLGSPDSQSGAGLENVTSLDEILARTDKVNEDERLGLLQNLFQEATGLDGEELTGHASLIFDNLDSVLAERQSGVVPEQPPEGTHKECLEAYAQKRQWHLENNNAVPASFGKITEYVLTPVRGTNYWVGAIDLCTWIGTENYYFNISFLNKGKDSLTLYEPPFNLIIPVFTEEVVDSLEVEDIEKFQYKLHANGKGNGNGAVVYKNIFENGVFLEADNILYKELEMDCFDTFYVNKPTGVKAIDLDDQLGYCMGRCDGKVLNTAS